MRDGASPPGRIEVTAVDGRPGEACSATGVLEEWGLEVRVWATSGDPVIFAQASGVRQHEITVLFWGSYRGRAQGEESGFWIPEAVRALGHELPVNVKVLLVGETDPSECLREHRQLLHADLLLHMEGDVPSRRRPEIILGEKGILVLELIARGPRMDVGCTLDRLVPNPAWKLVWALSSIRGPEGRIQIDAFFDDVRPPGRKELECIDGCSFDTFTDLERYGLDSFVDSVIGSEAVKRLCFWPSCSVNGFHGGYTGAGTKTVMPSEARARLTIQLVPDQKSEKAYLQLCRYLVRQGFGDIEVHLVSARDPAGIELAHPLVPLLTRAVRKVCGCEPIVLPMIGTATDGKDRYCQELGLPVIRLTCGTL